MSTHVLTHGALSEPCWTSAGATHDRKGMEGKGIGSAEVSSSSSLSGSIPNPSQVSYGLTENLGFGDLR